jgi:hypothetical protein
VKLSLLLWPLCAALFLTGCDKKDSDESPGDLFYTFPLTTGYQWSYRLVRHQETNGVDSVTFDASYVLRADSTFTAPDGSACTRVRTWPWTEGTIFAADYLQNRESGLYLMGSDESGTVVFAPGSGPVTDDPGQDNDRNGLRNVVWWDGALLLPYPAASGSHWTFHPSENFTPSAHTIEGTTTVTVPAGDFPCIHKQIVFSRAGDDTAGRYDYYYGSDGLIKAVLDFGTHHSTEMDSTRSWEEYQLTDYGPYEN